jgi:hypothetical protein
LENGGGRLIPTELVCRAGRHACHAKRFGAAAFGRERANDAGGRLFLAPHCAGEYLFAVDVE